MPRAQRDPFENVGLIIRKDWGFDLGSIGLESGEKLLSSASGIHLRI